MKAIYKREIGSHLHGLTGWVMVAALLFAVGIYFTAYNLNQGYPYFGAVLSAISFMFIFIVPALTMRSFAEEKRQKTDQLLLTAPVSVGGIVLGKYFALLTVFAIPTVICGLYPLVLRSYGQPPMVETYATLLAFFLLGAACIAVGMFFSAITENQIIAFIAAALALLVSYLMRGLASFVASGSLAGVVMFSVLALAIGGLLWYFTRSLLAGAVAFSVCEAGLAAVAFTRSEAVSGAFTSLLDALALFDRFDTFLYGAVDLTAYVYLISVAALFVFFTAQVVEKRRWS